jgi:hypothetical protein
MGPSPSTRTNVAVRCVPGTTAVNDSCANPASCVRRTGSQPSARRAVHDANGLPATKTPSDGPCTLAA